VFVFKLLGGAEGVKGGVVKGLKDRVRAKGRAGDLLDNPGTFYGHFLLEGPNY
jgi:hypothetical protein